MKNLHIDDFIKIELTLSVKDLLDVSQLVKPEETYNLDKIRDALVSIIHKELERHDKKLSFEYEQMLREADWQ